LDYDYDPIPLDWPADLDAGASLAAANSFLSSMRRRRSVRHFSNRSVDRAIIEACVLAAGSAPSGANRQPWHFACISDPETKHQIRLAAEKEERAFYGGKAGKEWLGDLRNLGTDARKPFLEIAPWLIAIFAERYSYDETGARRKNYYTPESVGIATGILIAALHTAGLATLTHTPSPMGFLKEILRRPDNERAYMLLVVGYPADDARVPRAATIKKPLRDIASFTESPERHGLSDHRN
jgi:nitroreductase